MFDTVRHGDGGEAPGRRGDLPRPADDDVQRRVQDESPQDTLRDGKGRRGDVPAVKGISFDRLEVAVPAFATLILIPLTFSITQGILWGFVLHAPCTWSWVAGAR